ncbi:MAG: hypothetical protein ACKVS9_08405, partial [Phycisphaerae bacterium]
GGEVVIYPAIGGFVSAPAKYRSLTSDSTMTFGVVAQSTDTQNTYTGSTDADGLFYMFIPESELGSTFVVTFVNPDGNPMGTTVFEDNGDGTGKTGVELNGEAWLGTVVIPETPGSGPVKPGDDANFDEAPISDGIETRLNADGAPIGAGNVGKGDDSLGGGGGGDKQNIDADQDGMVDFFDADDNGDGTIDDLDPTHTGKDKFEDDLGLRFFAFMNLKIGDADAGYYFGGDVPNIEKSLKEDTVITFDLTYDGRGSDIASVRVLPAPAPVYLTAATLFDGSTWSSKGYELNSTTKGHYEQFVIPNNFVNAGDTFLLEVTFADGNAVVLPRMLNFVFKSIPKLNVYGTPAAPTTAAIAGENLFDGTQPLVLKWNPPVDERGNLLVGFDYRFEIFFRDMSWQQINNIDGALTWPTPPTGFRTDVRSFDVPGSSLSTLDGSNQLSIELPAEIFVDLVFAGSSPTSVFSYTVDIAAQKNGNNSALKVNFEKQP